jgi:CRP/FNR family transcriptional regulator
MEQITETIYNEIPDEFNFDSDNLKFDEVRYDKGQLIFKESLFPNGIYFIKKGKVKIYKTGPDGKEKVLRLLRAGDFVGYKDLISRDRYSYSASAFENSTLFFISKDNFSKLLERKDISLYFLRLLSNELSGTENEYLNLSYMPVKGRLIEALLSLNDNSERSLAISRDELAGFVGSARETVIRLLSELRKQKLISIKGRLIHVEDMMGLNRIKSVYN